MRLHPNMKRARVTTDMRTILASSCLLGTPPARPRGLASGPPGTLEHWNRALELFSCPRVRSSSSLILAGRSCYLGDFFPCIWPTSEQARVCRLGLQDHLGTPLARGRGLASGPPGTSRATKKHYRTRPMNKQGFVNLGGEGPLRTAAHHGRLKPCFLRGEVSPGRLKLPGGLQWQYEKPL